MNKKTLIISSIVIVTLFFVFLTVYLITSRQIFGPRAGGTPPSCPNGTQLLFTLSTSLKVGSPVALDGKITSLSGNPNMENRNGVPLVQYVPSFKVTFPKKILLDSALIFDNDPKKNEQPWTINGVTLPATGGGSWGPLFKLGQVTDAVSFDHGGDSSHINVCVKENESPTSTPTPEPSDTPAPTEELTPTPTEEPTPTPSHTPTPSSCPLPNPVTEVTVSCENCNQP